MNFEYFIHVQFIDDIVITLSEHLNGVPTSYMELSTDQTTISKYLMRIDCYVEADLHPRDGQILEVVHENHEYAYLKQAMQWVRRTP